MRIIAERTIKQYWEKHPNAKASLIKWMITAQEARWQNIQEVRAVFPHADLVTVESGNTVTVFNIAGNHYRLIVKFHYNGGRAYVLKIMTHAEYDKNHWKKEL